MKKPEPIAVLISDIHYNITTLEVADKAMRMAINKANELNIRLVICGDLHDTKANIRGECANALIKTIRMCHLKPIILRGNHDSINEKSDITALEFLRPYSHMVDKPCFESFWFIPYQHDINEFKRHLDLIIKDCKLIIHQGVTGSLTGHYIQDKSAIPKEWLAGRRVISGHYHTRQDIPLSDNGLLSYIGNPYTLGFGEATDPEKGYQILYDDGSLEFVPTNLRRHRIIELNTYHTQALAINPSDILWIKITGPSDELAKLHKSQIAKDCGIKQDFRLDLIPTDTKSIAKTDNNTSRYDILDNLIDGLQNTIDERKLRLKQLWRKFT